MLFDEAHKEFQADIPANTPFDRVTVSLRAQDLYTGAWSHAELPILLSDRAKAEGPMGLSTGTIAGIAAVIALNALLIGAFVWLCYRRRKRQRQGQDEEKAQGYDESPDGDQLGGPIYRLPSGEEADVEQARGDGEKSALGPGWHKKSATMPSGVIAALAMPITPGTPPGTDTAGKARDSPGAASLKKYLTNPFNKAKPRPQISNPILHPSYSNAAFQAQLAIAVDAAGIVKRGGTFEGETSLSEFTPSGTYTGAGSTQFSAHATATEMARSEYTENPISEYTAAYTTETETAATNGLSSGTDVGETSTDEPSSSVVGKRSSGETSLRSRRSGDRASWESDAPFVWNTEVGGGQGRRDSVGSARTGMTGRTDSRACETTEFGTTEESEGAWDPDPPVQRSDFRPRPPPTPPVEREGQGYVVRHTVVTPDPMDSEEGFSIDQIHFPTESDIARTEASLSLSSDPSELEGAAVITTASRVDARRTLESPILTNSPQSDITERVSSPVMAMHSRLVSFGKQRTVHVTPSGDRRSASQPVELGMDDGSPGAHSVRTRESDGSGETTPVARPRVPYTPADPSHLPSARSGSIRSGKKHKTHRSRGSSISHSISRSRSPTPPMPDSFPSLPALPTAYSLASAKSIKSIASRATHAPTHQATHSAAPSLSSVPLPPQTRVLLGVNEPFHFYPPLMLASPTMASTTTAYTANTAYTTTDGKPVTPPGATYAVYGEQRGGQGGLVEMPEWLHFEDMELWGVPGEGVRGKWDIRVVERRDGERGERVVGRFALEVS